VSGDRRDDRDLGAKDQRGYTDLPQTLNIMSSLFAPNGLLEAEPSQSDGSLFEEFASNGLLDGELSPKKPLSKSSVAGPI
jgi:hypothetical protein